MTKTVCFSFVHFQSSYRYTKASRCPKPWVSLNRLSRDLLDYVTSKEDLSLLRSRLGFSQKINTLVELYKFKRFINLKILPLSNLGWQLFLTYLRAPSTIFDIIAYLSFSTKVLFFLKLLCQFFFGARRNFILKIDACELNIFSFKITRYQQFGSVWSLPTQCGERINRKHQK